VLSTVNWVTRARRGYRPENVSDPHDIPNTACLIQTPRRRRYPGAMIYEPEFADRARTMCRLGATDEELAEHFEVCVRTIYRWRNTHEAFAEAVIAGKEHADARVERALYSRAVGCTVERTKVFKSAGEDPVHATYQHHLPPDPNAALQWLRVRQPKKWGAQQAEDMGDFSAARMVEKALARVKERREANPMPARQLPPEVGPDGGLVSTPALDPDALRDGAPVPEPGSCAQGDPPTCPDEDDDPPPPPAPPPRPIPPGFPLERVRFGYG